MPPAVSVASTLTMFRHESILMFFARPTMPAPFLQAFIFPLTSRFFMVAGADAQLMKAAYSLSQPSTFTLTLCPFPSK